MVNRHSVFVMFVGALNVALGAACSSGGASGAGGGSPLPAGGEFHGTYEVPVSADLAKAALYDVPVVGWSVTDGVAKLEYDLPLGLVGTPIRVEFVGPAGASAPAGALSGAPGTADCTVAGTAVSCLEKMAGLLPIEPDYAVVEQLAKAEYAGPTADRVNVTKRFISDPIGIVHFDLGAAVDDSHGGSTHD